MPAIDVLSLDRRKRIYDHVKEHPGTHLRQIARDLELPLGTALYHLDYLVSHEVLVIRQDGRYKRFFVRNSMGRREKDHITVFRHSVPRRVAEALLAGIEGTQRSLIAALGVSRSTLSFHLNQMVGQEIVSVEDRRPEKLYKLIDADTARAVLGEFSGSFAPPVPEPAPEPASPFAPALSWASTASRALV